MRSRIGAVAGIAMSFAILVLAGSASAAPPVVTTPTVEDVSYGSATLKGQFNAEVTEFGHFAYYSFETSTDGGASWSGFAFEGPFEDATSHDVEKMLTGLKPGTEYAVRLSALNFEDPEVHSDEPNPTFTTLAIATDPVPLTGPATAAYTTAHLSGTIDPEESPVTLNYHFEYSTDPGAEFWSSAGFGELDLSEAEGTDPIAVEADLTGLDPLTKYHYRLVVSNGNEFRSPEPFPSFENEAVTAPNVTIESVGTTTGTTVVLRGTVNPGGTDPAFDAKWHFDCTPACPGLKGGTVVADGSEHPITETATGLEPNTAYEVKLVAENLGGQDEGGPISFSTEVVEAEARALWAAEVQETSAVLGAEINPKNNAGVTYQFEWGATPAYDHLVPASFQALGFVDNKPHLLTAEIGGLSPDTAYHYRVVADDPSGPPVTGPDRVLVTDPVPTPESDCGNAETRELQRASTLADCRAWERVSRSDKNLHNVSGIRVSPDGARAAYRLDGGGAPGASISSPSNVQVAARNAGVWSSIDLTPPQPFVNVGGSSFSITGSGVVEMSNDLTQALVTWPQQLTPDAPNQPTGNLYLQTAAGEYSLLTPGNPDGEAEVLTGSEWVGGKGAERAVFVSAVPQTASPDPVPAPETPEVYEWQGGALRLISVLPNSACGSPPCLAPDGAVLGSDTPSGTTQGAVSEDGARVFFHAVVPETLTSPFGVGRMTSSQGIMYVRENRSVTRPVSASRASIPNPAGPLPALFWGAEEAHGERVLFSTCERLTDDSNAEYLPNSAAKPRTCQPENYGSNDPSAGFDLYLYDLESDTLTDITAGDPDGGRFLGVLGTSDDFRRVYFVAKGILGDGAVAGAVDGKPNVYLWNEGSIRFITSWGNAPLVGGPSPEFFNWENRSEYHRARVSPDGGQLLFDARANLTAYDSSSSACSLARCRQVYLYDLEKEMLSCVSCAAGTASASGDANLRVGGATISSRYSHSPRNLSDDGQAFFEAPGALVEADTNSRTDVYEFSDGVVHLISSGSAPANSRFVDADTSGDQVFFTTVDRLASEDRDDLKDLYDAKVEGGAPPVLGAPECEGDACLPPPVVPGEATPGSASQNGPGDAAQARANRRCRQGQVRRKGKCVRKRGKQKRTHSSRRSG